MYYTQKVKLCRSNIEGDVLLAAFRHVEGVSVKSDLHGDSPRVDRKAILDICFYSNIFQAKIRLPEL